MKRHINFGSIDAFRNIIKNVQHSACYLRFDKVTKLPVMDRSAKMPKIIATASEKIHGTNAAVCFSNPDGFWVQSRENIITVDKDNAGCAFQAEQNKEEWMNIIRVLATEYEVDLDKYIISVFYEWAGGNIQSNSAVSGLDKRSMIFQHFKVSPIDPIMDGDKERSEWKETYINGTDGNPVWLEFKDKNIFNIMNFPVWEFEIDFSQPLMSQNDFIKLVEETIEPCSPVGKEFGKEGNIGEGIVVTFMYKGVMHRFKVKGEKHSKSKVKTLKPVDDVKEQAKIDFANYACAPFRLEQAWQKVFGIENSIMEPNVSQTGNFLKAVVADVMKEELDIMAEKGLEPKEVNGKISDIARRWFMEELDKEVMK